MKIFWLIVNIILLAVGTCGTALIMRLYFAQGGGLIWFLTWLCSAGCPIILLPLAVNYIRRRSKSAADAMPPFFVIKPKLLISGAAIGILAAAENYFYCYGMSELPVSTFALIGATQLVFTASFAFLIVKQKFTPVGCKRWSIDSKQHTVD